MEEGTDPHRFVRCANHLASVDKWIKEQVMPKRVPLVSGGRLNDYQIDKKEDLDQKEHAKYLNDDFDEEHKYLEVVFGE